MRSAAESRSHCWSVAAAAVFSTHAGCAATDSLAAHAEVTLASPRLLLDLPAGVEVFVDGAPIVTRAQPVELATGAHDVKLATSCGSVERPELEVLAGETLTLDDAAAPDIQFGTLRKTPPLDGFERSSDDVMVGRAPVECATLPQLDRHYRIIRGGRRVFSR